MAPSGCSSRRCPRDSSIASAGGGARPERQCDSVARCGSTADHSHGTSTTKGAPSARRRNAKSPSCCPSPTDGRSSADSDVLFSPKITHIIRTCHKHYASTYDQIFHIIHSKSLLVTSLLISWYTHQDKEPRFECSISRPNSRPNCMYLDVKCDSYRCRFVSI